MSKEFCDLYDSIIHINGLYKKELTTKEEETIQLVYKMIIEKTNE